MATRRLRKRSRKKQKRLTITAKFNRYAVGLSYFGIETPTKKKATTKALKELQKQYAKVRKQLREQGMTDLPTIAQINKYVKEAEQEAYREPEPTTTPDITEGREELPYAEGTMTYEDLSTYALDEFRAIIEEVAGCITTYINSTTQSWIEALENSMAKLEGAVENYGADYVDEYLSQSPQFDSLRINTFASYDDVKAATEDILDVVDSLLDSMRT